MPLSARTPDTLAYSGQNDFISGSPDDTRVNAPRHSEVTEMASNPEYRDSEVSWQEKLKSPYQKERIELYWGTINSDFGIYGLLRGLKAPDLPDNRKQEIVRFCLDYLFSPYVSQTACWNGMRALLTLQAELPSQTLQECLLYVDHLELQWPPEAYWDENSRLVRNMSPTQNRVFLLFPLAAQAERAYLSEQRAAEKKRQTTVEALLIRLPLNCAEHCSRKILETLVNGISRSLSGISVSACIFFQLTVKC